VVDFKVGQIVQVVAGESTAILKENVDYKVQKVQDNRLWVKTSHGDLSYYPERFQLVKDVEKIMKFTVENTVRVDLEFCDFGGSWVPARILADDLKGDFPIVVAALTSPGVEAAYRLTADGKLNAPGKPVLREKIVYRYMPVFDGSPNTSHLSSWVKDKEYYIDNSLRTKQLIGHLKAQWRNGKVDPLTVVFQPYTTEYVQR
jgi:hypothetical protein